MSIKRGWAFNYFPGWWTLEVRIYQTFARIIGRIQGWKHSTHDRCPICGMSTREAESRWLEKKYSIGPINSRTCRNPLCFEFIPF